MEEAISISFPAYEATKKSQSMHNIHISTTQVVSSVLHWTLRLNWCHSSTETGMWKGN